MNLEAKDVVKKLKLQRLEENNWKEGKKSEGLSIPTILGLSKKDKITSSDLHIT